MAQELSFRHKQGSSSEMEPNDRAGRSVAALADGRSDSVTPAAVLTVRLNLMLALLLTLA